jgi:hypothetical protein
MKESDKDSDIESRLEELARSRLNEDVDRLPADVTDRLQRMRREAVQLVDERPQFSRKLARLLPYAGLAAAAALALVVTVNSDFATGVPELPIADEMEFETIQELELVEELEFVAWLEAGAPGAG